MVSPLGAPPDVAAVERAGALVPITVTSVYEAGVASAAGADSLVVQARAGGTAERLAPDIERTSRCTNSIGLAAPRCRWLQRRWPGHAETWPPRRGAIAAQAGTALLLADEADTNAAHTVPR